MCLTWATRHRGPSFPLLQGDNYINASEASAVHIVGTADVGVSIIIDVSLSDSLAHVLPRSSAPAIGGVFDVIVDASALLDGIITPLAITIDDDAGLESAATITPGTRQRIRQLRLSRLRAAPRKARRHLRRTYVRFRGGGRATLTCLFDGAASAACNSSTSHASSSMADGSHSFSVAAADAAGNAATSSRTFSMDATKPVLAEVTAVLHLPKIRRRTISSRRARRARFPTAAAVPPQRPRRLQVRTRSHLMRSPPVHSATARYGSRTLSAMRAFP